MEQDDIGGWLQWAPCDPETGDRAVAQLAAEHPRFFAGAHFVGGRSARLPFYKEHVLAELEMRYGDSTQTAFVLAGPQTSWLNGVSNSIHLVNELESLELTEDSVESYLRFFLMFLRADPARSF